MVVKTRSQNKMAGDEGTFDARTEVATIREEIAELKGMKAEMIEIKSLLKRFCSLDHGETSIECTTGEVSTPVTNGVFSNPVQGNTMKFLVVSNSGEHTAGVHFYIEPNIVIPSQAPIFTHAVRTTTHADVIYKNLNTQRQPVDGFHHREPGNPYGINWNHPFLSNHHYNPVTGQYLNSVDRS